MSIKKYSIQFANAEMGSVIVYFESDEIDELGYRRNDINVYSVVEDEYNGDVIIGWEMFADEIVTYIKDSRGKWVREYDN